MSQERSYFPRFIILQSTQNHRYLRLNKANRSVTGDLRFHEDYSTYGTETRFEVVRHSDGNSRLVHIRSLHNNKFWENETNSGTDSITATAEQTNEKLNNPNCTLFETHLNGDSVTLLHMYTRRYVSPLYDETTHRSGLGLDHGDARAFKFLDWESMVMLPDLIRIKCDNGQYAKAWKNGNVSFDDATNTGESDFQVSASRDGGIRLKSLKYGKYLVDDDASMWVLANGEPSKEHPMNTVFKTIPVPGGNTIALLSLSNGFYCKRFTSGGQNRMATQHGHVDLWTPMTIEEPIVSRKIDNVRYHFDEARRYDEKTVALLSDDVTNRTQETITSEVNLKATVTNTTNWSNQSVTSKLGVKIEGKAGIPIVAECDQFEISTEIAGTWNWGETKTETLEVGSVRTVTVPPMSRRKWTLMATRLSYDIPFSYTLRDLLADGTIKSCEKSDGLFTGHNGYGYRYEVDPLPLKTRVKPDEHLTGCRQQHPPKFAQNDL